MMQNAPDSFHVIEHPLPQTTVTTAEGARNVHRDRLARKHSTVAINQFPAQGSLSGLIQNQGTTDFYIRGADLTFVKKMYLEIQITNGSASAATFVNLPFWFQQIQLYLNGGSDQVCSYYPENLWATLMNKDSEQTACVAGQQNWSATTYSSTGITLAAGASTTYYLELDTLLNQCHLPLDLMAPPRIRCYWSSDILASNSALTSNALLTITNLQLMFVGEKLGERAKKAVIDAMQSGTSSYSVYIPERQILPVSSSSITAGTNGVQTLTSVDGTYCDLVCFLRRANAAAEEKYQFDYTTPAGPSRYLCNGLTLLDASGLPYYVSNLDSKMLKLGLANEYYNSTFLTVFEFYNWLFTEDPIEAHEDGKRQDIRLTNNFRFQFSNNATLANGAELVVLGNRLCQIDLKPSGSVSFRIL